MLIRDAQLGQSIVIYVDSNNNPVSQKSRLTFELLATVLYHNRFQKMTMLGWTKGQNRSMNSNPITFIPAPGPTAPGIKNYTHYEWISDIFECEPDATTTLRSIPAAKPVHANSTSLSTFGHTCSKCSEYYPDAMHDASAKFVCMQCKIRAKMFG
jgi:hypothetical protein